MGTGLEGLPFCIQFCMLHKHRTIDHFDTILIYGCHIKCENVPRGLHGKSRGNLLLGISSWQAAAHTSLAGEWNMRTEVLWLPSGDVVRLSLGSIRTLPGPVTMYNTSWMGGESRGCGAADMDIPLL